MRRGSRDRQKPPVPPVEKIELNDEHIGRRVVLALLLMAVGVGALTYAIVGLTAVPTGWQTVDVHTKAGPTCGDDFTLLYQISSRTESREVKDLYSDACKQAFQMFHSDQSFEGVTNVWTINQHPNEALEVDAGLYEAFRLIANSGRRELYLGPVYERYDDLFYCRDDTLLVDFDPRLNEDVREEYAGVLVYANDPQAVNLELLDGNRVRLNVSEEYLAWAKQEGAAKFIDFSWMRNAFIADYLAGELIAGGFTAGVLNSYDGFSRNLDNRGVDFTYPLITRWRNTIYPPADLHYRGPVSFARMRDYPVSALDLQQYYQLQSGEIRTLYLDTADALCRSSIDTLLCYSTSKGCGQLLLEMIPVYIADEFREEAIPALAREGTQSIYCQGNVVRYTEPEAGLENFFNQDGVRFTAEQIQ